MDLKNCAKFIGVWFKDCDSAGCQPCVIAGSWCRLLCRVQEIHWMKLTMTHHFNDLQHTMKSLMLTTLKLQKRYWMIFLFDIACALYVVCISQWMSQPASCYLSVIRQLIMSRGVFLPALNILQFLVLIYSLHGTDRQEMAALKMKLIRRVIR